MPYEVAQVAYMTVTAPIVSNSDCSKQKCTPGTAPRYSCYCLTLLAAGVAAASTSQTAEGTAAQSAHCLVAALMVQAAAAAAVAAAVGALLVGWLLLLHLLDLGPATS
jgi:hypothetical protein